MDELGEGHWNDATEETDNTPFDFGSPTKSSSEGADDIPALFPPNESTGNPAYVKRYRPGSRTLLSVDSQGTPLTADLSISLNYANTAPGIWDGTGDWFSVKGGWKLLPDRLGIAVIIDDPEQWDAGKGTGKIQGISWWADPTTLPASMWNGKPVNPGYPPCLRLTTVIEDDRMMSVIAAKRSASPTQFVRRRRADARDHFQYNRVSSSSMYNDSYDGEDDIVRDDTAASPRPTPTPLGLRPNSPPWPAM